MARSFHVERNLLLITHKPIGIPVIYSIQRDETHLLICLLLSWLSERLIPAYGIRTGERGEELYRVQVEYIFVGKVDYRIH
jgi:hypothetical protein